MPAEPLAAAPPRRPPAPGCPLPCGGPAGRRRAPGGPGRRSRRPAGGGVAAAGQSQDFQYSVPVFACRPAPRRAAVCRAPPRCSRTERPSPSPARSPGARGGHQQRQQRSGVPAPPPPTRTYLEDTASGQHSHHAPRFKFSKKILLVLFLEQLTYAQKFYVLYFLYVDYALL